MKNPYSAFMEMVNGEIEVAVDGSANWAKLAIDLPVSENESLACLVHYLWMMPRSLAAYLLKAGDLSYGSVAQMSLFEPLSASDVVNGMQRQGSILWIDDVCSVIESALSTWAIHWTTHKSNPVYFDPPLLIAQRRIWFSASQAGANAQVIVAGFCLGYTVERVTKDQFIAALVRG